MMKKWLGIWLVLLLCFPASALAHTKLKSAFPAPDATITEKVQKLTLSFGTRIENTSTFEVVDGAGKRVVPVTVAQEEKTMTGMLAQPLPGGAYTVNWSIIGADGHPTKGTYTFTVKLPAEQAAPAPAIKQPEPQKAQVDPRPSKTEGSTEAANSSNPVIWIAAILALGAAASFIWLLIKRKA